MDGFFEELLIGDRKGDSFLRTNTDTTPAAPTFGSDASFIINQMNGIYKTNTLGTGAASDTALCYSYLNIWHFLNGFTKWGGQNI